jgi:hypothetical protein
LDLLNTFLGNTDPENPVFGGLNPGLGVAQMLTPAVRLPMEWFAESTFGGVPMKDKSDYIDSQIPGGSYAAGITGVSPVGTLLGEGLFDDNPDVPWAERRMVAEDKYQGLINDEGAWSGDSITSLMNFLTGLGFSGMSHKNQRNFAQIESRNAAGGG